MIAGGRSHHNATAISRPVVFPMGKQHRDTAIMSYVPVLCCNLAKGVVCCKRYYQYPGRRFPSDLFGGDFYFLFTPNRKRGGGSCGYMERIIAILHADYYYHCCCFTGK